MFSEHLASHANALGVSLAEDAWRRLEVLARLWREYGAAIRLTGSTDDFALAAQCAEALMCVACAYRAGRCSGGWLDVGSGAGFPGLVVAATGDWEVSLVEPRGKRAAFLEIAVAAAALPARVIARRIEEITWVENGVSSGIQRPSGGFVVASARAVMDPATWLSVGVRQVEEGGIVLVELGRGADDPMPAAPLATVDYQGWSVRAYARSAIVVV